MKSGNLNFLEPSGPLQAYNGTDLTVFATDICGVLCKVRAEAEAEEITDDLNVINKHQRV